MAKKISTRPPVKQRMIINDLRGRILSGELEAGCRLPTRVDMEKIYGVSILTVQRALEQLSNDGFVCARGGQGTFVADHPPHLNRYMFVFPDSRSIQEIRQSRFWRMLLEEAHALADQTPLEIETAFGIDGDETNERYLALLDDVASHRVAGLIFGHNPFRLEQTALVTRKSLPRVALMSPPAKPGLPIVGVDSDSFDRRAIGWLRERGARRLAIMSVATGTGGRLDRLRQAADRAGIGTKRCWVQTVHPQHPQWAANVAELLVQGPRDERPDALLIADDNVTDYALMGLSAAGVRMPEDIMVLAHCNLPERGPAPFGLVRLGYDMRAIVRQCLDVIDAQRAGRPVPRETLMPAVFESELPEKVNLPRLRASAD